MKRDFDLIRSILLAMEAHEHGFFDRIPVIEGYTDEQVGYHVYLMEQAGLLTATALTAAQLRSPCATPRSLTWDGHEFLGSMKDDTLWNKAKATVLTPLPGVALDVLFAWLKAHATERLGLA